MAPDAAPAPASNLSAADLDAVASLVVTKLKAAMPAAEPAPVVAPAVKVVREAAPPATKPTDDDASRYTVAEAMQTGNLRLVEKVREYWANRGGAER